MKPNDSVGVTFVNVVLASGTFNNVINVTLGVCLFTPNPENSKVDDDIVVASRLRMDPLCARQLRDALTKLLEAAPVDAPEQNGAVAEATPPAGALN